VLQAPKHPTAQFPNLSPVATGPVSAESRRRFWIGRSPLEERVVWPRTGVFDLAAGDWRDRGDGSWALPLCCFLLISM
jgi:hypothetical protein